MTNEQYIRNASLEELAKLFIVSAQTDIWDGNLPTESNNLFISPDGCYYKTMEEAVAQTINWLLSERIPFVNHDNYYLS